MSTTSTAGCGCGETAAQLAAVADREQRRVLMIVLAINVALFVGEFGAGWWAGSTALQADSLDSLGDAGVYALSLFVVGRSLQWRAGTAVVRPRSLAAVMPSTRTRSLSRRAIASMNEARGGNTILPVRLRS